MKKKLIAVCLFFLYVCNDNILIKADEVSSEENTEGCSTTKFTRFITKFDEFNVHQEREEYVTQGSLDGNNEEKSCCPGYNPKIFHYAPYNLTQCEPICSNGCPLHQFCTEPDTCVERNQLNNKMCNKITCVNGCLYERDEKSKDYCLCPSGYEHTNETICTPVCEKICRKGFCIAPNVCFCSPGYNLVSFNDKMDICEPLCDPPCANGICISPNYCECALGFSSVELANGSSVCQIPCNDSNCRNGSCIDNECRCDSGFQFDHQSKSCLGDTCGPNNNCKCGPGYKNSLINKTECVPDCGDKCTQQEVCVSPGKCQCLDGYTVTNGTCRPHCDNCDNGNCTAPNVCVCNIGFVSDAVKPGICVPVCDPPCVNGVCIKPNACACHAGYGQKPNVTSNVCCDEICLNSGGSCGLNGDCECSTGYTNLLINSTECVPDCGNNCTQHEVCVAPGKCHCLNGYVKDGNDVCTPHCQICENGYCIEPNNCVCDQGFVLRNGTCVSNILGSAADTENRVALWCVLSINKRISDVSVSFENHENKFSCHSTGFCQITCDVDDRYFTANRSGFIHCNVTAGAIRESGQLTCYGVNFPSTTIRSHAQCPSTLINQTEHQSVYAFFVNFTMAEENSHGPTDNCTMCPCSQKTNVSVYGVLVEAYICPCTPENPEQPYAVGISEKYISRIYLLLLAILICLLMIAIIRCIRSRMYSNKYYLADIANVPTNSELLDDAVKLNHVKYNYPNNNSNSNDYKVL